MVYESQQVACSPILLTLQTVRINTLRSQSFVNLIRIHASCTAEKVLKYVVYSFVLALAAGIQRAIPLLLTVPLCHVPYSIQLSKFSINRHAPGEISKLNQWELVKNFRLGPKPVYVVTYFASKTSQNN